jgi:hypothetical protein
MGFTGRIPFPVGRPSPPFLSIKTSRYHLSRDFTSIGGSNAMAATEYPAHSTAKLAALSCWEEGVAAI